MATDLIDTFKLDKIMKIEVVMSSKRYSEEFKIEAIKQVTEKGIV